VVLTACSSGATLLLDSGADGTEASLAVGESIDIALPGNPTTGYTWDVVSIDSSVLAQQGDPSFRASSNLVGSGGIMTLAFEAIGAGTTALQLVYHRPFGDASPEDTFSLNLVVSP